MIYKKLSAAEVDKLINWAEANNVHWDVWNPEELLFSNDERFMDGQVSEQIELGLERWPDDGK